MGTDCPFAALGVAEGCTRDELAQAFRAAAHRTHPDHGGDAAEFRRVRNAYREAMHRLGSGHRGHRVRRDPYQTFLTELDAAARLPVAPEAVSVVAAAQRRPSSAERFAEVLRRVASDPIVAGSPAA